MAELEHLADFNRRKLMEWSAQGGKPPKPNGIACPACGTEMVDTCPASESLSDPPQLAVHCPVCKYTGYRFK